MKAAIFDMDGTLFQTDTILEAALNTTFSHLRSLMKWQTEVPLVQYREIMGVPLPQVWETLLPDHTREERAYTDAYFLECLIKNIKSGKGALYPHVLDTFKFLKKNDCSIYIASNGLTEYLEAIIHYYSLNLWVTETFSIQQIDSLNKADLVQYIVKKYSITDGAVIGDRLSDIQAAKVSGLTAVGCRFDFAQEKELAHADFVITDLLQLKDIFPKLSKSLTTDRS